MRTHHQSSFELLFLLLVLSAIGYRHTDITTSAITADATAAVYFVVGSGGKLRE